MISKVVAIRWTHLNTTMLSSHLFFPENVWLCFGWLVIYSNRGFVLQLSYHVQKQIIIDHQVCIVKPARCHFLIWTHHKVAYPKTQVAIGSMFRDCLASHSIVDCETTLDGIILHHDCSVVHHPFTVNRIPNFGCFKAIHDFPVMACIIYWDPIFALCLFYQDAHEFSIWAEVQSLGRQKFWALNISSWVQFSEGPDSCPQLHIHKGEDLTRISRPTSSNHHIVLNYPRPSFEFLLNHFIVESPHMDVFWVLSNTHDEVIVWWP